MKVHVDAGRCQGHTLCHMVAPALFELDDEDGHARAIQPDVPVELEDAARKAEAGCPEQAISITD
jgi:ferredoxin